MSSNGHRYVDIPLNSWNEFCEHVKGNEERYKEEYHKRSLQDETNNHLGRLECGDSSSVNFYDEAQCDRNLTQKNVLYRGQECASWELETTLERYIQFNSLDLSKWDSLENYLKSITTIPEIGTGECTPPNNTCIEQWIDGPDWLNIHQITGFPCLVHLRHAGYPSPLLDWTISPYVAAFFAFRKPSADDKVAIYMLKNWEGEFIKVLSLE